MSESTQGSAKAARVIVGAEDLRGLVAGIFAARGASAAGSDEAIAGASECGIGWASVRGTVHTGTIGYYASRIADANMAAVGVVAGVPNMAYAGAKGTAVATSPLAVAVPAGKHELVLLDMATGVMALGRIAQLKAAGKELPPGVALTAEGEPTTDPALAKVPTRGRRRQGRRHVLVFEMLASGLAANPIVRPSTPARRRAGATARTASCWPSTSRPSSRSTSSPRRSTRR
jgi:LDH2 family malate/lactate/ureidoglycolate dehydrogenase